MNSNYVSAYQQHALHAHDMFERNWRRGCFERLIASIKRAPCAIRLMADLCPQQRKPLNAGHAIQKPVRVERIVGTAGSLDFDQGFRPLRREKRARWISVAVAMMTDPHSLPPIRVVEVGQEYYVVDGHHRVSVAKALKRLYLDAQVVSYSCDTRGCLSG
ncbi:MAG: ParB N-terminal domain-containing protein [Anaerolineae bacterium]|nr:ParB N-terminal domain-containing protein [Anaerolineae bacterium]